MTDQARPGREPGVRIGITMGDPAGIGPEVVLKAVTSDSVQECAVPVVIGDAHTLAHQARKMNLPCAFDVIQRDEPVPQELDGAVLYNLANIHDPIPMGRESEHAGRAAGEYIEQAVRLCMEGAVDAIATAPINKKSLFLAGYPYPGHTEFLGSLTGTTDFAMGFISDSLRIVLLTTHMPLSAALLRVKKDAIERVLRLAHRELQRWGIEEPRIAVAALNPHGAEGGLFGIEEASEILPAIESSRLNDGIKVSGPYSADTIFLRTHKGEFDAVLACYHDQGMIPIKCLSFGEAVNVTLGLPFIRTSVDHGTAFDIAGKGVADASSMVEAIRLAAELFRRGQHRSGTPAAV